MRALITENIAVVQNRRNCEPLQTNRFSIFVDETTDITMAKWLILLARYVHPDTLKVQTRILQYFHLNSLEAKARDLVGVVAVYFRENQIALSNIVSVQSDSAPIMVGCNNSFYTHLKKFAPKLISMGCICHLTALAATAACAVLPPVCQLLLKDLVAFLSISSKRKDALQEFVLAHEYKDLQLIKLSGTRWLVRFYCVDRFIYLWRPVKEHVQLLHYEDSLKPVRKKVTNDKQKAEQAEQELAKKKLQQFSDAFADETTKAYFYFQHYALNQLNMFNASYQKKNVTRVHLIWLESLGLLYFFASHCIIPSLLPDKRFSSKILDINFADKSNYRDVKDVNLGPSCEEYIRNELTFCSPQEIQDLRSKCLQFYETLCTKLIEHLPFNDDFLRRLRMFHPHFALNCSDRISTFKMVILVAKGLLKDDEYNARELYKEWSLLYDLPQTTKDDLWKLDFDEMWIKISTLQTADGLIQFPELNNLLSVVRKIGHSNADAERGFSFLPDLKTKKRNRMGDDLVNANIVIRSAMRDDGVTALTMEFEEEHYTRFTSEILYPTKNSAPQTLALHSMHEDDFDVDGFDPSEYDE